MVTTGTGGMLDTGDRPVLVLDTGSSSTRAGLATSDAVGPSVMFPSLVGHPRHTNQCYGLPGDSFVGESAEKKRASLNLRQPVERGAVTDYDDMQQIIQHVLDRTSVDPGEHPVLLADAPLCPKSSRETLCQMLFESFDTPAFYVTNSSVLSVYGSGRTTGVGVACGDAITTTVPVYEGFDLRHASRKEEFAGRDLDDYLAAILTLQSPRKPQVEDIKQTMCYVAQNYQAELESENATASQEESYRLPDGQKVNIGSEKFQCPETLFQPCIGMGHTGVHINVFKSIGACDVDIQGELSSNLVLSGGSTLFPGFAERLQTEVSALFRSTPKLTVNVTARSDRQHLSWIGGSILASLSAFHQMAVTQQEYSEYGSSIVNLKCL